MRRQFPEVESGNDHLADQISASIYFNAALRPVTMRSMPGGANQLIMIG